MKILVVNSYYGYGSTGKIVEKLYLRGKQIGHEMYSIYWLKPQNHEDKHIIFCGDKEPNGIYKILQWLFLGGRINYNEDRTNRIIDVIKKIKPDIIHLHNLHGDFEFGSIDFEIFFNFLVKYNHRVIWTLHDCWALTGRCYHFEYKKCFKWKEECKNCPQRFYDREGIIKDYCNYNFKIKKGIYEKMDKLTIITVSKWLENVVKQSILKNADIKTIYNGIDTSVFIPNYQKEGEYLMCIGWDRKKGYPDYIKIARAFPEQKVVVVGNRPLIRKMIKLPNNIIEMNYKNSPTDMAELYQNSKLYFNASKAETFGLTTVEALSCGIPVIGYNTTATPEVIGENGYVIKENDFNELQEIIRTVIDGNNILKKKRHDYIQSKFNIEEMINNYMEEYGKQ